ncbi:ATP-binding protein [Vibrio rotiferianus]|uniref:ATP-binding protein n=1 Tax=Vibrio rotiferianus TaxID=190895 RepID=UPI00406A2103
MFSTFTRLYIAIITGLTVTVSLFVFLGDEYMRKTEVEIFLNDGAYFANQYIAQKGTESSLYKELTQTGQQDFYIFKLALLDHWDETPPCDDCKQIYRLQSIPVYLIEDSLYGAVFPLPNSTQSLLFKEKRDFFRPDVDWHEDSELIFVLSLVIVVFSSLGVMIYIPVRSIESQIIRLSKAHNEFGSGELQCRVDPKTYSDSLGSLAQGFNDMAEDIERRVKQSHILTQAIPHEVRTPLSRIQLATDIARLSKPEQQEQLFNDIDRYVGSINELTQDIVKLSRLSSQKKGEGHATTSLNLLQWTRERLAYHGLNQVVIESCIECNNEQVRFQQTLGNLVIDNLIQNAARYGEKDIYLAIHRVKEHWVIDIEDDGPGIPSEKHSEVFLPFSRLDKSRNADKKGFGLGLAIATSAARQLDWKLSVGESHLGGARFTVLIPANDQDKRCYSQA